PRFGNTQDSEVLGLIVPVAKFFLAEYLLAFNISCSHHLWEEYVETQNIESPYKAKEGVDVYTVDELYKILKNLDDQSIRRFLINVDDIKFSALYKSIRSSDFESFKRLMEDKSTSFYSKLINNEVFRFDVLSEKIVNNDKFYSGILPSTMNLGFAAYPTIADCSTMLENIYDFGSCSFNLEKCTAFMNIYPVAMAEINREIIQIQECERFSTRERKDLLDISDRYSFLFEDADLTLYGQSPDSMEVIKRKAIKLGKALHTNLLDELNSEVERKTDKDVNKEQESESFKIREFIMSGFKFENKEAESYFKNNYLDNICSYISSLTYDKDFEVLCYLLYPFYYKQRGVEDLVKKHLTGKMHWLDEPKDKYDCANRLFIICNKLKRRQTGESEYKQFSRSQKKICNLIIKMVGKPKHKWMIRFVNDYWPKIERGELTDQNIEPRQYVLDETKRLEEITRK
ncbi:MAG: hypothetical protein K2H01_00570, partial [Ruminococcus sp.]|nr:hypothetical protein [Ruminococcus sp.]